MIIIIIIIITLIQEDNIFGRVASQTYGAELTNVGMILYDELEDGHANRTIN